MSKVYKYTLTENYKIVIPSLKGKSFNNNWCNLYNGTLTIFKGYSWDGCSPKYKVLGIIIGTPDGWHDQIKECSLVHDVLYQFQIGYRKVADDLFFACLKKHNWKMAKLYYWAVRTFGHNYWYKK